MLRRGLPDPGLRARTRDFCLLGTSEELRLEDEEGGAVAFSTSVDDTDSDRGASAFQY